MELTRREKCLVLFAVNAALETYRSAVGMNISDLDTQIASAYDYALVNVQEVHVTKAVKVTQELDELMAIRLKESV